LPPPAITTMSPTPKSPVDSTGNSVPPAATKDVIVVDTGAALELKQQVERSASEHGAEAHNSLSGSPFKKEPLGQS